MQFYVILRGQLFSHVKSRTITSRPSRECCFYNFRARPLPIFVIWAKYATRPISLDSEMAIFFGRAIAHAYLPTLLGALLL